MTIPKIVIAGTQSGVGKTTVSLALMAGFKNAGYRVQAFKVGPDYIDPSYHGIVTGFPSHNLDTWLMGEGAVRWLFQENTRHCDIAVIEGVMGLFDGASSRGEEGSTAQISKLLGAPVILVLDARSLARSAAAMVMGYKSFDPGLNIAGVILNRVASPGHFTLLQEAIESSTQVPVLGALFRDQKIQIPERHLGLKTASENEEFRSCLKVLAETVEPKVSLSRPGIDLLKILEVSRSAVAGQTQTTIPHPYSPRRSANKEFHLEVPEKVRIGIARDRAFSFYYQANLDFLTRLGAELVPFSPLEDESLPDTLAGIYFGGGFPEVYARELQGNERMRQAVSSFIQRGFPVYAECGGLMYLTGGIEQKDGKVFEMVGVLPGKVRMTEKLQSFGYAEATLIRDCFLGKKGDTFRGHEFHYSSWDLDAGFALHQVKGKRGTPDRMEGYCAGQLLASYIHCHFLSYPERAVSFIQAAKRGILNAV